MNERKKQRNHDKSFYKGTDKNGMERRSKETENTAEKDSLYTLKCVSIFEHCCRRLFVLCVCLCMCVCMYI